MAIDVNKKHKASLGLLDHFALFMTNRVGTMGFFFACVLLVTIPLIVPSIKSIQTLPIVQYISSGYLQLILLPLIMVGQNLQSRKDQIRAQGDYDTDRKAEEKIEVILTKLEAQGKDILHILEELEKRK